VTQYRLQRRASELCTPDGAVARAVRRLVPTNLATPRATYDPFMKTSLEQTAAESSRKTLAAFAEIVRALAPEVLGASFHDAVGETLWLSEDFLLPEDHALVEDALAHGRGGAAVFDAEEKDERRYVVVIPVRGADGELRGAARLSLDPDSATAPAVEPLELRLAPLFLCLAAEIERVAAVPRAATDDPVRRRLIEQALRDENYELFLQPIHSLRAEEAAARYEVLLRLRMPDSSLLEPTAFLGQAATLNLLAAADRWVVRNLLVWLLHHRKHWARTPTIFAVNLSVQALMDPHFVSFVEACLVKSRVPPQALCFEIAERSAASGNSSVAQSMKRLEALGCEVALDQFGATAPGYAYLRDVPANYFKIDGSLVTAAPSDRVANAMISAIVRMASNLGVQTVAGSVELDSELEALRELGVDYAQGYLLGRPESLSDYRFNS
jgi:EAL domain-containing protein (putative c-di-GMP-specific phosphodiesterase class I)